MTEQEYEHDAIYEICPLCQEALREPARMAAHPGFVIFQAVSDGGIVHRHNNANWSPKNTKKTKAEPESDLASAIIQAIENPDDEEARQTAMQAIIIRASSIAENEGAGAMSALQGLAGQLGEVLNKLRPPSRGERCRLCGRLDTELVVRVGAEVAEAPWLEAEA